MNPEAIKKIYELLEGIPVTPMNKYQIANIKELLEEGKFEEALPVIKELRSEPSVEQEKHEILKKRPDDDDETETQLYPKELLNDELESTYIGLLLTDPKSISKYYFKYDDCCFANDTFLNLYKIVLFTDGEAYASEEAKKSFNFAKDIEKIFALKQDYKLRVKGRVYNFENIYVELRKLFVLRKNYLRIPIRTVQEKIIDIKNYKLYDQMSIEEVESAVNQAEVTSKFKQSVLNVGITNFLTEGSNNLSNGLDLPFPILSHVFKGIRCGETSCFAMPSNAGKSRFTVNLATYLALVQNQKVQIK